MIPHAAVISHIMKVSRFVMYFFFFYILIKLVCVSGNEKVVKIIRQFFFFVNKTPSNTCTLDTHVHAHTCAMHA